MASTLRDEILIQSSNPTSDRKTVLVFMITGNPGLIEYYRPFLTFLHARINSVCQPRADFHIYGASLSGFEINTPSPPHGPLDLNQQIESVMARLVRVAQTTSAGAEARDPPVILIGHSVGSYILLEILHRLQTSQSSPALNIVGGICLFPTIVDIAKSPTGRKTTPLLLFPGFALAIHLLSKLLFSLLPLSLLIPLVQILTGMPAHSATTTAAFLQSPTGVRQALHMAKHEMLEIAADDRWSEELWGVKALESAAAAEGGNRRTKLYFYWGENDHWVADETRDVLLQTRGGSGEGGLRMEVDGVGTPHGFCVREGGSRVVAGKVAGWVDEVVDGLGE